MATPANTIKERLAALEEKRAREAYECDNAMASGTQGVVSKRLAALGEKPKKSSHDDAAMARALQAQYDAELARDESGGAAKSVTVVSDTSGDEELARKLAQEWGTLGY